MTGRRHSRRLLGRHPRRLELMAHYDGELGPARTAEVAEHVRGCGRCQRYLDELVGVGAAVRGEPVPEPRRDDRPVPAPRPAVAGSSGGGLRPRPVVARAAPALLAAAALVALVLAVGGPERGGDEVVADGAVSTTDGSPSRSPDDPERPPPGQTSGEADDGRPPPPEREPSDAASPTTRVPEPRSRDAIAIGVMVPGGADGPRASEVHAVRAAARASLDASGEGGSREQSVRVVAADADDPGALDRLREEGVDVLAGGHAPPAGYREATAAGIPWFGPSDVVSSTVPGVVPVEVPHRSAGRLLGATLTPSERQVLAVTADAPERALAEGLRSTVALAEREMHDGSDCRLELQEALAAGADTVALALPADDVARCLAAVEEGAPVEVLLVPTTAVDEVLDAELPGVSVLAVLGAPSPLSDAAGVLRFEEVTGLRGDYGALVSFAATELALDALRRDPGDPLAAFFEGGAYRSDLLALDPTASPHNRAVQVVDLGTPDAPPSGGAGSAEDAEDTEDTEEPEKDESGLRS